MRLADALDNPRARSLSLHARTARGSSLERAGRLGEALAVHREVIERFGRDTGADRRLPSRVVGCICALGDIYG